jgi:hypothetical protein
MKAFVQNGYGSADVYELLDVEKPQPSPDEVGTLTSLNAALAVTHAAPSAYWCAPSRSSRDERLLVPERLHRRNARGPTRRPVARGENDRCQDRGRRAENGRIPARQPI